MLKAVVLLPLVLACLGLFAETHAADKAFPPANTRVVFLGDSITFAGHYVASIDAWLRVHRPGSNIEIINIGLPSETAGGLSEPDHPFPRPTVQERIDRVLAKSKPDIVVACYGMNDGIYYPFSEERFKVYQKGINLIIEKVKKSGAKLVLLTPPPFDPLPLKKKGKLKPAGEEKYAWFAIYENYDDVMAKYAAWILEQKDRVEMVIDVRTPISSYTVFQREGNPDFVMSGDGVHIDKLGHDIMARAILNAWNRKANGTKLVDDKQLNKLVAQRETLLRFAWLSHSGHKRPGVKKGLPLSEANKQAAALDAKIKAQVSALSSK